MSIVEIFKIVGKNLDKALIAILIVVCFFLYFKTRQVEEREVEARIEAQNRIAELSEVIRENETTWSRLAQQAQDTESMLHDLHDSIPALSELIEQRNEEISSLTRAVATVRPIHVTVDANSGAEESRETSNDPSAPERLRVDFNTILNDVIRITGHTLTNPAFAEVEVDFTRPINLTVVTTQAEDLSWRTYIESDWPNLEIGNIESQVNPFSRPADQRRWEQDLSISLLGGAAVTGNAGYFGVELEYDFGPIEVGVGVGGISYFGSTDFTVGGRIGVSPFDL